ncbi:ABC transporter substrate-binding protein [Thermococcus henrietii]|uniref:ABC transporter substrate-binding protein n=1 Tax=Thermococcus henrietii TaxID=2016361 RepID=UPI000C077356|nr:ABC transporter substrate-binding protein [Thermococcus henrietii]
MKRYLAVAVVAIMLGSLFGFASVSAASTYPRNETLYTANSAPPTNANPFSGGNIIGLDGLIFEPLAMLNFMTGQLKPWLAESWKWVKPNVFEVKLRPGLKWQDGKPLTAEDVKFSYEYYQEMGLRNWTKLGLKEIKVVDNRTVDFIFSGTPNYQLWQLQLFYGWGQGALIIPEHIFKNLDPKKVAKMTFLGDEMKYLVGSGPYKLYKVVQGQKAILIRNDDWWGNKVFGKPAPKYIIQLYIKDNAQAANAFIKGDLDVGTYYIDIVQAKKQNPYLVSWLDKPPYFPPVAPVLLYFNTKKPPMNNPQFRRAIAMAINPKQIITNGPIGGMPSEIPFGTGLLKKWANKIDLDSLIKEYGWQYGNIAEANKILDQLGMKKDSNGWRTYNGKEIVLHLVTCAGCSDWISTAQIIQNQLRALGIKVVIDKYNWGTMMSKYHNGDFDLGLHWAGTFQPTAYAVYNALLAKDGVANFGNYTNPKAQQILDEFAKTTDPNKEAQYIKELSEIWLKDVPAVPVYMATLFYEANTKYWTNWPNEKNPYGVPIFWAKYGTWGTALALLGVKPTGGSATVTHTSSQTSTNTATSTQAPTSSTTTSKSSKGICGPAAIVGLAVVPLLLRRRRR